MPKTNITNKNKGVCGTFLASQLLMSLKKLKAEFPWLL